MAFERPTMPVLIERVSSDLEAHIPGADARVRRSNLSALARVQAGATYGLYGYLSWLANQLFPDTAEREFLDRWTSFWGVTRKVATLATGTLTITGSEGAEIPEGAEWQRSDGVTYTSTAAAIVEGGSALVSVQATTAGEVGNASSGTKVTLIATLAGVNSTATVDLAGLTNGVDEENDAAMLSRLLERIQEPPHGGASSDYERWALEVAGVTRVWVYPHHLGLGTVGVTFVCDEAESLIPDADKVAEVQEWIDTRRPVTADLTVFACLPVPVNFTLQVTPDTTAVRAAVEAELVDLLRREAAPACTLLISHLREAVSIAVGETDHVFASPTANLTYSTGEFPVMGVITWV